MGDYKTIFLLAACSAGNSIRSQGRRVNAYRFPAEICVGSFHGSTNGLLRLNGFRAEMGPIVDSVVK